MKTLLFLRHAKSDRSAEYEHDHERPLNARGEQAARLVGRTLSALSILPDAVLTSTAIRARRTVELVGEAGGWSSRVREAAELYLPDPEEVLREIQAEPDTTGTLLVVGHEPAWSVTVGRLVGGAAIRFPTAALACVRVPTDRWADVRFGGGELQWLLPPRVLAQVCR